MKRLIILLISILLLSSCADNEDSSSSIDMSKYPELFQSSNEETDETEIGQWSISVNDITLENSVAVIYDTYAELPLMPVLKALAFEIQWQDEKIAKIKSESNTFILNLSEKTVKKEGSSTNLIPKNTKVCRVFNKDIILDATGLYSLMDSMKSPIKVTLDYDLQTVIIKLK